MNESRLRTIEQLQEFLEATPQVQFSAHGGDGDSQRYKHISTVLRGFDYPRCFKADRKVVRVYLARSTGYSRAQLTRLVSRWGKNRLSAVPLARCNRSPMVPFRRKYTEVDIQLLVEMDRANEDICGPAIVHPLQRAWLVYGGWRHAWPPEFVNIRWARAAMRARARRSRAAGGRARCL